MLDTLYIIKNRPAVQGVFRKIALSLNKFLDVSTIEWEEKVHVLIVNNLLSDGYMLGYVK